MTTKGVVQLIVAAAAATLLAAPAMAGQAAAAAEKTLTGVVSDAMCGATHMMKNVSAADCARACVKQGSKYALVVGKDVYPLTGHEAELDKYAAQTVTVKGRTAGKTVTVSSVAPATLAP